MWVGLIGLWSGLEWVGLTHGRRVRVIALRLVYSVCLNHFLEQVVTYLSKILPETFFCNRRYEAASFLLPTHVVCSERTTKIMRPTIQFVICG